MGFFDKIMRGLGFETKEEPKQVVEKSKKRKVGTYELEAYEEEKLETLQAIFVKSQKDINRVIDMVEEREKVLINFSSFPRKSYEKALAFLEGACYALKAQLEKAEDGFVIIPLEKDI